jgi:rhamnogalacturonan endolyase
MKIVRCFSTRCIFAFAFMFLALTVRVSRAADAPVTVKDNGNTWTLDNGIVKATINKRTGEMQNLIYKG